MLLYYVKNQSFCVTVESLPSLKLACTSGYNLSLAAVLYWSGALCYHVGLYICTLTLTSVRCVCVTAVAMTDVMQDLKQLATELLSQDSDANAASDVDDDTT